MKAIELWFQLTFLFQLTFGSIIVNGERNLHSRIMTSIRTGNLQELQNVVDINPEMVSNFNLAYWTMASHNVKTFPNDINRRKILTSLFRKLANKNQVKDRYTPLIFGVLSGNVEVVKKFIRSNTINTPNKYGETALIAAVRTGNIEIVKELVYRGADVNIADKKGFTALQYATSLNDHLKRSEAINLLLSNWATVSCFDYPKYVIKFDEIDTAKLLNNLYVVTVELSMDELLMKRLLMDFEENAKTVIFVMFLLTSCVAIQSQKI